MINELWVFNGENARFPSGIFTEREIAESWIRENKLSGVLTLYPLNKGLYSWAIEKIISDLKRTPKKHLNLFKNLLQLIRNIIITQTAQSIKCLDSLRNWKQ